MKQYTVTGMSCAACSARVEKAVSKVPGVTSCSVSLLTNSMGVEGTAAPQEIIRAVENAGYGAAEKKRGGAETAGAAEAMPQEEMLKDRETPLLKKRLVTSVGFLAVLMYFSMGHMMWGWPLPAFFEGNHVAMGLVQLLLTVVIMVINQKYQRIQESLAPGAEYGHTGSAGGNGSVRLQYLRALCNDRCTGARRYGRGHELHARVLL